MMKDLSIKILDALAVKKTKEKVAYITNMLEAEDCNSSYICDYLGKERRGNRAIIRKLMAGRTN